MTDIETVTYWIAVAVLTGVLVWALRLVGAQLQQKDEESGSRFISTALSEKERLARDADGELIRNSDGSVVKIPAQASFSRLAGALGAIGIAALYVSIGYWILNALFQDKSLDSLEELWPYLVGGAALFFPYAFNRLSKVFSTND